MKTREQDYPTRAEYAAALSWWEILTIARKHDYSQPVAGRDGLGLVGRCLVSLHERRRPSGRRNWTPYLVSLFLVMGGVIAAISIWEYGDFALAWILLGAGTGIFLVVSFLVAISAGAVLAFRAGGWEQMLRDRDRELAWEEQSRVMRGDSDGGAGRPFGRFWRRVRRVG